MTPNEQGRHCTKCDKTIVDFSLFTDKQLIEFFANVTGRICGNYNPMQVNRELIYVEPKNYFLHKLFFGIVLTAGIDGSAYGNYNYTNKPLLEQCLIPLPTADEDSNPLLTGGDTAHYIKGKLFHKEDHSVISGAFITLKGYHHAIKTDSNGNFKLYIPKALLNTEITIMATNIYSYGGYYETTINLIGTTLPMKMNIEIPKEMLLRTLGDTIAMPIKQDSVKK